MKHYLSFFISPAFPISAIFALMLCLTGCEPDVPSSYFYNGTLSSEHPNRVLENYRSVDGKLTLVSALVDVTGDGVFDHEMKLRDGEIISLNGINSANYSGASYRMLESGTRPEKFGAPPALLALLDAAKTPPDEAALDALYADGTPAAQTWLLAERLRNAKDAAFAEGVLARAKLYLERGRLPAQSAFILVGLGEKGAVALGKVLRGNIGGEAALGASAALRDSSASIAAAFEDMLAVLADPAARHEVLQNIFQALEAELPRNPGGFFEKWWNSSPELREKVVEAARGNTGGGDLQKTARDLEEIAKRDAARDLAEIAKLEEIAKRDAERNLAESAKRNEASNPSPGVTVEKMASGGPSLLARIQEIADKRAENAKRNPQDAELSGWFADRVKNLHLKATEFRSLTTQPTTTNSLP